MIWKVLSPALTLTLILVLLIPTGNIAAQGIPNPDHIIYARVGTIYTCDPHWAYDTASGELIQNVYEPLCAFNSTAVDEFIPMVADWWLGYGTESGNCIIPSPPDPSAPLDTNQTWYFHIRTGVPWQNSTFGNVTTADVEYSFERGMLMDPAGAPMWMFYDSLLAALSSWDYDLDGDWVINETEYSLLDADIDNAIQQNGTHVWFNLKKPYSSFQQILCETWSMIICKQWAIEHNCWNSQHGNYTEFLRTHDPPEPGPLMEPEPEMMGSGPYMVQGIDLDPHTGWYTLEKFDAYWRGWPAPGAGGFAAYVTVKIVEEWLVRKTLFVSGQADCLDVPITIASELHMGGDIHGPTFPGIRMVKVPNPSLEVLMFTYNVNLFSGYVPKIGETPKPDLFSDRHMRLAFAYCLNFTQYIADVWLGDAEQMATCIPNGTLYYNASKPKYNYDLANATQNFQSAWNGTVWTEGITVYITFTNIRRQVVADMLAYTIENLISWPDSATVDIHPVPLPWILHEDLLRNKMLCCYFLGFLADFPDPHQWATAFMHPTKGYSDYQEIDYGLDPATMNWENQTYGPPPYTNALGESVTEINNTYVAHLIEAGHSIMTCDPIRQLIYEELMDIYHAEASQLPLVQSIKRHYERTWIKGWIGTWNENLICPGQYFYTMWKALEEEPDYVDVAVIDIELG